MMNCAKCYEVGRYSCMLQQWWVTEGTGSRNSSRTYTGYV